MSEIWEEIAETSLRGEDAVVVTVVGGRGSIPTEIGAKALVNDEGLVAGTVGGGKVEALALKTARSLLGRSDQCELVTWNLQKDVEMTCGGEIVLLFEKVDHRSTSHVVVFGAGHVVQALIPVLAPLPFRIEVVDTRLEWIQRIDSTPSNVSTYKVDTLTERVDLVTEESLVLCISRGHSTDQPVLQEVMTRFPKIAFIGAIGSAAKRAVLLRELTEAGISDTISKRLVCPLGLPLGSNAPAEIAISIAAQLLQERDARRATST